MRFETIVCFRWSCRTYYRSLVRLAASRSCACIYGNLHSSCIYSRPAITLRNHNPPERITSSHSCNLIQNKFVCRLPALKVLLKFLFHPVLPHLSCFSG